MQVIAPVTDAQLLHPVQKMLYLLEIYDGAVWQDMTALGGSTGKNYLKTISVSVGGPGMGPEPVAGTWSAVLDNENGIFHPYHPTSVYADLLHIGREVRISVGANYGGVDYYWQRLIGFMDAPRFNAGSHTVDIGGFDYTSLLADMRLPDTNPIHESGSPVGSGETSDAINGPLHWGARATFDSVSSSGTSGAEQYDENDAMERAPGEVNSVASWTPNECTFVSLADVGGGSAYVGRMVVTGITEPYVEDPVVGSLVSGTTYLFRLKYRRVIGAGAARLFVTQFVGGNDVIIGEAGGGAGLTSDVWVEVGFLCPAILTGACKLRFEEVGGQAIGDEWRIDEFSMKIYEPTWFRYEMPADCNGPYFVTLDGEPVWQGERDGNGHFDGWLYDEATRYFCFDVDRLVEAGVDNLDIYYYTDQSIEQVVADLIGWADPLGFMPVLDVTPTGVTIPRVWFDATSTAFQAIQKICERVNYRFWVDYAGVPHFHPAPVVAPAVFDFPNPGDLQGIGDFQDVGMVRNRIVIEGSERAMFQMVREDKSNNRFKDELSDAVSIAEYLEKTYSITNNLFQAQAVVTAMCATLLAEFKDPKWYADLQLAFNPVPLELGDTISWVLQLAVGTFGALYGFAHYGVDVYATSDISVTVTGIIRAISINDGTANYKCEVTSVSEPESGSASASSS